MGTAQPKNFYLQVEPERLARSTLEGSAVISVLMVAGVPVTMVEDAAVAYVISRCQMVLVGAEAVAESGGIINKTGT